MGYHKSNHGLLSETYILNAHLKNDCEIIIRSIVVTTPDALVS